MTRPTKEDVGYALEWFSQSVGGPGGVLRAEVLALREDKSEAIDKSVEALNEALVLLDAAHTYCKQLEATIARVEALVAKWRSIDPHDNGGIEACAEELENALKGEP